MTVLAAALSEDCKGGYWTNGHREMTTSPAFDPGLELNLWEVSMQLLGLQRDQ